MGGSLARLLWDGLVHVSASSGGADEMMMFNRGTQLKGHRLRKWKTHTMIRVRHALTSTQCV
jgi:hypothetical protein